MKTATLYQCIPAYKPNVLERCIPSLTTYNCQILLDLEDSIQNILDPVQNTFLKARARLDLLQVVNNLPDVQFSIRINAINSDEFINDKYLLKRLPANIVSVFIPKVSSANELNAFYNEFGNRFRICLILESRQAIENIDEILSIHYKSLIDFVFFGNYDYHLDMNMFPIIEQNSIQYFDMIAPVITKIEDHGLCFGNSPYAYIGDLAGLGFSFLQLQKKCKKNFAVMSLHKSQTRLFNSIIGGLDLKLTMFEYLNKESFTTKQYERNKLKGRSFAIDNETKCIFTPQEYYLVKQRQNG